MNNKICAIWKTTSKTESTAIVLPDGCRDLIVKSVNNEKPEWFISPLFNQAKAVNIEKNASLTGFRLRPGVRLSEEKLLTTIVHQPFYQDEVCNLLDDWTTVDSRIEEALACLASDVSSVKQASLRLGVNIRTLQRLIIIGTEKTPGYWFQLARIRKAARSLSPSVSFAETADVYKFSDQSHMNKEFKRWFNLSPSALLGNPSITQQLYSAGYG